MQIATRMKAALERLQVWEAFMAGLQAAQSYEGIQAMIERTKAQAKLNRNRLALTAHPDRGGSVDAMQELNAAYEAVEGLVCRPVPQVRVVQVAVHIQNGWQTWAPTTSSTTSGGWW
jgi:hypothetical protein